MNYAALLLLAPLHLYAQDYAKPPEDRSARTTESNFGLGGGFDYGGFGAQMQVRPLPGLAFFGGGGYAVVGFGWNVGAMGRLLPDARWCPYGIGMYGYNAAIAVRGASQYNKLYYGLSFGLGVEMHRRDNPDNFWRFEFLLPVRDPAFQEDIDALKRNPLIDVSSEPPDFGIGVGYHFGL
jgi:hypothetical protein